MPGPSIQSGDFKQPTNSELYLGQLVELNQKILKELQILNSILALNGLPLTDDLDTLRADPASDTYLRS